MRMMILTVLIYLTCLIPAFSERTLPNYLDLEECEFLQLPGYCRELSHCPSLLHLLISGRGRPRSTFLYFLRSLHCGFKGKEPIVCCPKSYFGQTNYYFDIWKNSELGSVIPEFCGRLNLNYKIFGGSEAGLNDFPWMALIGYDTPQGLQYRCGGTLINRRYVLTAAHCLTNLKSLIPKSVRLGEHDLSSEVDCSLENGCAPPAKDFPIKRFISHPEFQLKDLRHDIALIELAEDVNYSESVQPVCLPVTAAQRQRNLNEAIATIVGWGATENGTYSHILRKAEIRILPHEYCRASYENISTITNFQICAGGEERVDSCSGDSGGPLKLIGMNMRNELAFIQYGLVSFGPRICGSLAKPGVYTKIAPYISWILQEIRKVSVS